jgi:hypothetical protein
VLCFNPACNKAELLFAKNVNGIVIGLKTREIILPLALACALVNEKHSKKNTIKNRLSLPTII